MPDDVYQSTLRLPRELADRLHVASIVTGRSIAKLTAEALTTYVQELERRPELAAGYDRLRATVERATAKGDPA